MKAYADAKLAAATREVMDDGHACWSPEESVFFYDKLYPEAEAGQLADVGATDDDDEREYDVEKETYSEMSTEDVVASVNKLKLKGGRELNWPLIKVFMTKLAPPGTTCAVVTKGRQPEAEADDSSSEAGGDQAGEAGDDQDHDQDEHDGPPRKKKRKKQESYKIGEGAIRIDVYDLSWNGTPCCASDVDSADIVFVASPAAEHGIHLDVVLPAATAAAATVAGSTDELAKRFAQNVLGGTTKAYVEGVFTANHLLQDGTNASLVEAAARYMDILYAPKAGASDKMSRGRATYVSNLRTIQNMLSALCDLPGDVSWFPSWLPHDHLLALRDGFVHKPYGKQLGLHLLFTLAPALLKFIAKISGARGKVKRGMVYDAAYLKDLVTRATQGDAVEMCNGLKPTGLEADDDDDGEDGEAQGAKVILGLCDSTRGVIKEALVLEVAHHRKLWDFLLAHKVDAQTAGVPDDAIVAALDTTRLRRPDVADGVLDLKALRDALVDLKYFGVDDATQRVLDLAANGVEVKLAARKLGDAQLSKDFVELKKAYGLTAAEQGNRAGAANLVAEDCADVVDEIFKRAAEVTPAPLRNQVMYVLSLSYSSNVRSQVPLDLLKYKGFDAQNCVRTAHPHGSAARNDPDAARVVNMKCTVWKDKTLGPGSGTRQHGSFESFGLEACGSYDPLCQIAKVLADAVQRGDFDSFSKNGAWMNQSPIPAASNAAVRAKVIEIVTKATENSDVTTDASASLLHFLRKACVSAARGAGVPGDKLSQALHPGGGQAASGSASDKFYYEVDVNYELAAFTAGMPGGHLAIQHSRLWTARLGWLDSWGNVGLTVFLASIGAVSNGDATTRFVQFLATRIGRLHRDHPSEYPKHAPRRAKKMHHTHYRFLRFLKIAWTRLSCNVVWHIVAAAHDDKVKRHVERERREVSWYGQLVTRLTQEDGRRGGAMFGAMKDLYLARHQAVADTDVAPGAVHKMEGQMEVNHVQLAAKLGELDSKVSQVLQRDRMGIDFDMVFKTAGELGRNAPISALMDRLMERGIPVPADLLDPQQSLPGVTMAADAPVDASVSASQTTSPDSGDPVVADDIVVYMSFAAIRDHDARQMYDKFDGLLTDLLGAPLPVFADGSDRLKKVFRSKGKKLRKGQDQSVAPCWRFHRLVGKLYVVALAASGGTLGGFDPAHGWNDDHILPPADRGAESPLHGIFASVDAIRVRHNISWQDLLKNTKRNGFTAFDLIKERCKVDKLPGTEDDAWLDWCFQ